MEGFEVVCNILHTIMLAIPAQTQPQSPQTESCQGHHNPEYPPDPTLNQKTKAALMWYVGIHNDRPDSILCISNEPQNTTYNATSVMAEDLPYSLIRRLPYRRMGAQQWKQWAQSTPKTWVADWMLAIGVG